MAVHFMFTASKQYESVPVAGDSIPLGQLKDEIYDLKFRAALEKRRIKEAFDFRVYDAETKEEIVGAQTRVPRHSRVLVKRVPAFVVSQLQNQQRATQSSQVRAITSPSEPRTDVTDDGFGDDVFSSPSVSSDRTSSGHSATSKSTASRSTEGVPKVDVVSTNRRVVRPGVVKNRRAVRVVQNVDANLESVAKRSVESAPVLRKVEIPRDIACSLCHDIMKDPVLIPCCCTSFCRNCVSIAILEHQKCPSCGSSKCRDSDVLPNRSLSASVDLFRKSNGIASNAVPSSGSCSSSQPHASSTSSEHERSESTTTAHHKPSAGSSAANSSSQSQMCEKRKRAPLCISLGGAKKAKPLRIALTGAKAVNVVSCI